MSQCHDTNNPHRQYSFRKSAALVGVCMKHFHCFKPKNQSIERIQPNQNHFQQQKSPTLLQRNVTGDTHSIRSNSKAFVSNCVIALNCPLRAFACSSGIGAMGHFQWLHFESHHCQIWSVTCKTFSCFEFIGS